MRKLWVVALVAGLVFGIGTASAQEISVGYQGFIGNGNNGLSGLSVRGWSNKIGYEGTIYYGDVGVDTDYGNVDADVWILDGQLMYAAVVKENSKFYIGIDFGYGQWEVELQDVGIGPVTVGVDDSFMIFGPLLGAEYSFQGLPELGFNWEVSYEFVNADVDVLNAKINLNGLSVTMGIHYKF